MSRREESPLSRSLWEKHAQRYIYDIWPTKICLIEDLPDYDTIMDLGCGDGIYIPLLTKKSRYVIGADISFLRLKRAKNNIALKGLKDLVDFILLDAKHLPFRTSSIGLVFALELFEHFSNTDFKILLAEIERVSFALLATIPNPHALHFKADPTHILRYTVTGLIKYLRSRQANFRYRVRGLDLPLVRERSLKNRALNRLTKEIIEIFPWLSTTLVITGERR